nr:hypothetical protein [Tanacetum cinerariifolium]
VRRRRARPAGRPRLRTVPRTAPGSGYWHAQQGLDPPAGDRLWHRRPGSRALRGLAGSGERLHDRHVAYHRPARQGAARAGRQVYVEGLP